MNVFPLLAAKAMLQQGCHASVAIRVYHALSEISERQSRVLWLRLQGRSYSDISDELGINKGFAWKIIHGRIRQSIYSVIERSTAIMPQDRVG